MSDLTFDDLYDPWQLSEPDPVPDDYDPWALDTGPGQKARTVNGGVGPRTTGPAPLPQSTLREGSKVRPVSQGAAARDADSANLPSAGNGSDDPEAVALTLSQSALYVPGRDSFMVEGWPELPAWVEQVQEHQWKAAEEIVEGINDGVEVVYLDAPTGSGKTLIAELVRRLLRLRSLYICSTKTLQDQFASDYPYSSVLKGRSNYPTQSQPYPDVTAADCTKHGGDEPSCEWCPQIAECEYEKAKSAALRNPLAVINTSYLLTEANYVGHMSGRDLVIADEADTLEQQLMGFVEYRVTDGRLDRLGLSPPVKGARKTTILRWMEGELEPAVKAALKKVSGTGITALRERQRFETLLGDTRRIIKNLTDEVEAGHKEDAGNWVRDNDRAAVCLKPVRVDEYGEQVLWRHGKLWLCMSATIISGSAMDEALGTGDRRTSVVSVPMTFPVENRRIKVYPVASNSKKERDSAWPTITQAIGRLMDKHPSERILIHTVSFEFAKYIHRELRSPRCLIYTEGSQRDRTLAEFRSTSGAVLLAASMDRGVDLKGDDCRVVIVAKVPFPNLGDRQVSSRLHSHGGQTWFNVETIRSLVQMTGRGVRGKDDWCVTYILDAQFLRKIWRDCKLLLPKWWRDAVDIGRVKELGL